MTHEGEPVDLTGYEARAQIRPRSGGALLGEFTIDLTDLATGVINFSLTSTQTTDLVRIAKWDIEIFQTADPETTTKTLLFGDIEVIDQITRSP